MKHVMLLQLFFSQRAKGLMGQRWRTSLLGFIGALVPTLTYSAYVSIQPKCYNPTQPQNKIYLWGGVLVFNLIYLFTCHLPFNTENNKALALLSFRWYQTFFTVFRPFSADFLKHAVNVICLHMILQTLLLASDFSQQQEAITYGVEMQANDYANSDWMRNRNVCHRLYWPFGKKHTDIHVLRAKAGGGFNLPSFYVPSELQSRL